MQNFSENIHVTLQTTDAAKLFGHKFHTRLQDYFGRDYRSGDTKLPVSKVRNLLSEHLFGAKDWGYICRTAETTLIEVTVNEETVRALSDAIEHQVDTCPPDFCECVRQAIYHASTEVRGYQSSIQGPYPTNNLYVVAKGSNTCYCKGEAIDLALHICNHSPTGVAYGYSGSGAAQLALAILNHESKDYEDISVDQYMTFKEAVIATADPERDLIITRREIRAALGLPKYWTDKFSDKLEFERAVTEGRDYPLTWDDAELLEYANSLQEREKEHLRESKRRPALGNI